MTLRSSIVASALVAALWACDARPLEGPPTLRLGRDECTECGMSILDAHCAAAAIIARDGGREYVLADDVGCLLDWEREHADVEVVSRFVSDHASGTWLAANVAQFVVSDAIRTPMASGIVAYPDRAQAEAARERFGGRVFSWDDLADARVTWLRSHGRTVRP
ncbi:MAG: nitrous oxide reductase accessory protein NosL [Phycisphaerales bacterium]